MSVPPPPSIPTGELVLHLRPPFANIYRPRVVIDGRGLPAHWGTNVFTVPAGTRRIEVGTERVVLSSKAVLIARVPAGERTDVFYTGPATKFSAGAIGFTEQPQPGRGVWFLIGGLILLVVVLALLIAGVALFLSR